MTFYSGAWLLTRALIDVAEDRIGALAAGLPIEGMTELCTFRVGGEQSDTSKPHLDTKGLAVDATSTPPPEPE